MRSFQCQVGASVHSYLTRVRLRQAREMLIRGEPAVEAAIAVGFVDQSHLIRRLKDTYGAPPGGYVRESRIVK
jgi:AraC-like DNA-binding protein